MSAPDGFGFDKASRNRAEEKAAVESIPPLNPEFPWDRELFDPEFFGFKASPEEEAKAVGL